MSQKCQSNLSSVEGPVFVHCLEISGNIAYEHCTVLCPGAGRLFPRGMTCNKWYNKWSPDPVELCRQRKTFCEFSWLTSCNNHSYDCYSDRQRCNGINDCPYGEDELHCSTVTSRDYQSTTLTIRSTSLEFQSTVEPATWIVPTFLAVVGLSMVFFAIYLRRRTRDRHEAMADTRLAAISTYSTTGFGQPFSPTAEPVSERTIFSTEQYVREHSFSDVTSSAAARETGADAPPSYEAALQMEVISKAQ